MKMMNFRILALTFLIAGFGLISCENRQEMAGDNVHVPVGTGERPENTRVGSLDTLDTALDTTTGTPGNNSLNSDNTAIRDNAMTDTTQKMK